jgi:hypothetical protein
MRVEDAVGGKGGHREGDEGGEGESNHGEGLGAETSDAALNAVKLGSALQ